jgi:CMP-N-acetylneuraminic acid synthetase
MRAVAFIFARGGSKGLPGKNIRMLFGKPLIAWSIGHAQAVPRIERVIVSTDSKEIADVARKYGAEVPFIRPNELASDSSPEWLAWQHALKFLLETEGRLPEVMISIPTTAPLRLPVDIEKCLDEYAKGKADVVITVTHAHRNPYFNMVKENNDGTVGLVFPSAHTLTRRQDAPNVYDVVTVAYVMNPEFVMTHQSYFEGKVSAVLVPLKRSIDIDTLLDFKLAEFLLSQEDMSN